MTDEQIIAATVRLEELDDRCGGGQGVLIVGGFIVTAAHCLCFDQLASINIGDEWLITAKASDGRDIRTNPVFIDPVADIAVLGRPDNHQFAKESMAFDAFCSEVGGLPLARHSTEQRASSPARIRSHEGEWIIARTSFDDLHRRFLEAEAETQVQGGSSGGPILDARGELLGPVSNFSQGNRPGKLGCKGRFAYARRALPAWILEVADSVSVDGNLGG